MYEGEPVDIFRDAVMRRAMQRVMYASSGIM